MRSRAAAVGRCSRLPLRVPKKEKKAFDAEPRSGGGQMLTAPIASAKERKESFSLRSRAAAFGRCSQPVQPLGVVEIDHVLRRLGQTRWQRHVGIVGVPVRIITGEQNVAG